MAASVARSNEHATDGVDPDFGKGSDAYQRNLGDPAHAGLSVSMLVEEPVAMQELMQGERVGVLFHLFLHLLSLKLESGSLLVELLLL